MLHVRQFGAVRPGLERVDKLFCFFLEEKKRKKKMEEVLRKKLMEGQKDRIRAAELPILSSSFFRKHWKKETLKITCFRDNFKPRQVNRYDRVNVVREVPAGRWGGCCLLKKRPPRQRPRVGGREASTGTRAGHVCASATTEFDTGTRAGHVCASGSR